MKLKSTPLLLLLFCCCFSTANAQLNKGAFFLDGNIDGNYYFSNTRLVENPLEWIEYGASAGFQFNRMFTKRIMAGASLAVSEQRTAYNVTDGSSRADGYSRNYHRNAAIDFRYYFATKKWAPFVFFQTAYSSQKQLQFNFFWCLTGEDPNRIHDPLQIIRQYGIQREMGFGLSYLISKNIMLESTIGHSKHYKGSLEPPHKFSFKTNFRALFGGGEPVALSPLKDQLLRTGSTLLDGNVQWRSGVDETLPDFNLHQATTFFVAKRTALNGALTYSKFKNDDKAIHAAIGVHQYVDLTKNLLFSTQFQMRTAKTLIPGVESPDIFTEFPLAANLHFFHKRQRYVVGAEYAWQTSVNDTQLLKKSESHQLNSYIGMDYYLAPTILLQQKLNISWQTREVPIAYDLPKLNSGRDKLRYSFGFAFLL